MFSKIVHFVTRTATSLLVASLPIACSFAYSEQKYQPHIDLGGYYFSSAPHDAGFMGLYMPLNKSLDNLLYADLRGIFKGHHGHTKEGNFGLGFRHLNDFQQRLYGAYLFYDRKQTVTTNYFSQLTMGAETWLDRLFAGANFYLPVGTHSVTQTTSNTSGALTPVSSGIFNILITQSSTSASEVTLVGGDLSIGYQIIDPFIGYLGGYYYHSSVNSIKVPTILGAMLHARYSLFNNSGKLMLGMFEQITFEGQLQYDKVGGTRFYAGGRFSLGFGKSKLSRMERHMTEQALRDIDLVISAAIQTQTSTSIAKNDSGTPIQVNQVTTTAQFDSAVGNANVNVIAVQGVIPNANAAGTALATGQRITGGTEIIIVNGKPVTVQVSTGGELQSASGSNLIKVGKDNSISDITLTMVNPANSATVNRAIYVDTTVNDFGNLLISNVTSNGVINVSRSGATQKGIVVVNNSSFIVPSTWNPPSLPNVGTFLADNSSSLNATILNSTFISTASTTSVVGLSTVADHSGIMTVEYVSGSTAKGTDSGFNISASRGGIVTVNGDVANNTIQGGGLGAGQQSEIGLLIFVFGTPLSTVEIKGSINNNNIKSPNATSLQLINFNGGGVGGTIIVGGITNNTTTSTGSSGVLINPSTGGTATVNKFYGNTISPGGGAFGISLSNAGTHINVGQGSTGLSAANNAATITTSGSPTVVPGL